MSYEIRVSNVPDGAYTEMYICGPSNGAGSPNKALRVFQTRAEAEQVLREFYAAKALHPEDFESDMEAEIVENTQTPQ